MAETTRQARQDLAAARERLATEADELELAVRSAVDIPAKIRRSPGRVAALAGSAVFLAAGGPKRTARGLVGRLRRPKEAPVKSLLPQDVERIVAGLGTDAPEVRATLEREFAAWLEEGRAGTKGKRTREAARTPGATFWHLFDAVSAPLAARAAKRAAEQLFAAQPDRQHAGPEGRRSG